MQTSSQKSSSGLAVFGIVILVVAADQFSKLWIATNFHLHESRPVIPGFFDLVYAMNTGAAFGLLAGAQTLWRQLFFCVVAVVALIALFAAFRHYRGQGRLFAGAIGLIAGGALGNLVDRIRLGAVVDFLDFYIKGHHWPAFNVADSAITTGVGLFLLASLLHGEGDGIEE